MSERPDNSGDEDPLSAARGLYLGAALSAVIWAVVAVLAFLVL